MSDLVAFQVLRETNARLSKKAGVDRRLLPWDSIKNADVERLAGEVAGLAHETKTETRAGKPVGRKGLREYMERNVWPLIPSGELSRVLSRDQEDRIVGYGSEGY